MQDIVFFILKKALLAHFLPYPLWMLYDKSSATNNDILTLK